MNTTTSNLVTVGPMDTAINILIDDIKADFSNSRPDDDQIERFNNSITYSVGKKYIKIISNNSVWGFIVNTDTDSKFEYGDILKAANWKTPARNSARGNIITGNYQINWTGPNYLT